jgi:hypothetical protein
MDVSILSIIIFTITTLLYYACIKPKLTLEDISSESGFMNKTMFSLTIFVVLVFIGQFFINILFLYQKCGSNDTLSIGVAFFYTFFPWFFIFIVMIGVLFIFPGFKSAFSDVIGYYVISSEAHKIFSSLLIDTSIKKELSKVPDSLQKNDLSDAAEAIMKICTDKSILINKINPVNFMLIWDQLQPLMKSTLDEATKADYKNKLWDLVVLKDNIGEGIWYIYCGILISSITFLSLSTRGCSKSLASINADQEAYNKQIAEQQKQTELNNSVSYTM